MILRWEKREKNFSKKSVYNLSKHQRIKWKVPKKGKIGILVQILQWWRASKIDTFERNLVAKRIENLYYNLFTSRK